ncbi:MAG: metalloregulator ArsR/SmtB family transcription factor [Terracidiphilus sp.]
MPQPRPAADLALLFAALADSTRLRLLNLMNGREVCVCYFVEILRQGQPKISRHLAYLRRAGLVEARREGKWMHYRIAEPRNLAAARILEETLAVLRSQPRTQSDLARLNRACCTPQLISAPTPLVLASSLTR